MLAFATTPSANLMGGAYKPMTNRSVSARPAPMMGMQSQVNGDANPVTQIPSASLGPSLIDLENKAQNTVDFAS